MTQQPVLTPLSGILTETQRLFLALFSKNPQLSSRFYLSGGSALTGFYIPYRYSEDLDFFSGEEVDTAAVAVFLRSVKDELNYHTFDLNTSFNRNIYFLHLDTEILKTEFTYFPFTPIEKPQIYNGVNVDSILDIAVNKLFTIYQKPRSRDFMDLYMINKQYHFSIHTLVEKAKIKFDWHVDKLKLGAQFLLSEELKDYPKLIQPMHEKDWQGYFKEEAKKIGETIIE